MRHALTEARAAGCAVPCLAAQDWVEAQDPGARLSFTHSHTGMKISLEP